jgi:hypothetical protein
MGMVPREALTNLAFQLVVKALALKEAVLQIGLCEVIIVHVVDLPLVLLNKVLHSME